MKKKTVKDFTPRSVKTLSVARLNIVIHQWWSKGERRFWASISSVPGPHRAVIVAERMYECVPSYCGDRAWSSHDSGDETDDEKRVTILSVYMPVWTLMLNSSVAPCHFLWLLSVRLCCKAHRKVRGQNVVFIVQRLKNYTLITVIHHQTAATNEKNDTQN